MADLVGYKPGVQGSNNSNIPLKYADNGDSPQTYSEVVQLAAGSLEIGEIIGNVRIDQTTPGTTNGVVVNSSALPTLAATSTIQATQQTSLSSLVTQTDGLEASASSIDTKLSSQATAAIQATQQTSLNSLVAQTDGIEGSVDGLEASATSIVTQTAPLLNFGAGEYETVAASITGQVLGASGAAGDYLAGILVIPAVVACGLVTILDGATSIPVFVGGGTTALPSCIPFFIPLGLKAVGAGWSVTTGASVSCIASGNFT